jgi:hypothetical protein
VLWKRPRNVITRPYIVTSNPKVTKLWKSVQSVEIPWNACSGCAGDYEDPDRTAWEPDPEQNEGDTVAEESPARDHPAAPGEEGLPHEE